MPVQTEKRKGASMTLEERLMRMEAMLLVLVTRQQFREWYSTQEFALAVGKYS